jgi:hypothetical protein
MTSTAATVAPTATQGGCVKTIGPSAKTRRFEAGNHQRPAGLRRFRAAKEGI